jgi:CRP-like cAMP-binding protein
MEPVHLATGDTPLEPGRPLERVWFLEEGLASVMAVSRGGERIEVALVGREGMIGAGAIHGTPEGRHQVLMQVGGQAHALPAATLARAMRESPGLHAFMMRYLDVALVQVAHTALGHGRYTISERLCRWLLMCHDRLDGDDLPVTHDVLALVLGVRRPGVTNALHILEGVGIVKAKRGNVRILDRARLEDEAGDCYGLPEACHAELFGPAAALASNAA